MSIINCVHPPQRRPPGSGCSRQADVHPRPPRALQRALDNLASAYGAGLGPMRPAPANTTRSCSGAGDASTTGKPKAAFELLPGVNGTPLAALLYSYAKDPIALLPPRAHHLAHLVRAVPAACAREELHLGQLHFGMQPSYTVANIWRAAARHAARTGVSLCVALFVTSAQHCSAQISRRRCVTR